MVRLSVVRFELSIGIYRTTSAPVLLRHTQMVGVLTPSPRRIASPQPGNRNACPQDAPRLAFTAHQPVAARARGGVWGKISAAL